jgi:serine/threonine protein phosphatase PrpC
VVLFGANLESPQPVTLSCGQAVVFTRPHAGRTHGNQDALGIFQPESDRVWLAVADGVGGLPRGREAAARIIEILGEPRSQDNDAVIETRIKRANQALLEQLPGAATTVSVVEISGNSLTSYHAGDSAALVVGQRTRIKLKTQCHSPVGISEANGLLDEKQALFHPGRHLLNNMVGDPALWLEKMAPLELAARDTVLVASDGLWDNLFISEVVEAIRAGPMLQAAQLLADTVMARMSTPAAGVPSKPDDVSFILYRAHQFDLAD